MEDKIQRLSKLGEQFALESHNLAGLRERQTTTLPNRIADWEAKAATDDDEAALNQLLLDRARLGLLPGRIAQAERSLVETEKGMRDLADSILYDIRLAAANGTADIKDQFGWRELPSESRSYGEIEHLADRIIALHDYFLKGLAMREAFTAAINQPGGPELRASAATGTALRGLLPKNCSTWNDLALRAKVPLTTAGNGSALMYMPGGLHRITPGADQGSAELWVRVDSNTAATLNASLLDANQRIAPQRCFIDKEHEGKEATAWPEKFFWSQTPQPGVYVQVEFTASGQQLIQGKSMRAFSPSFTTDAELPRKIAPGKHIKVADGKRGSAENPARVTGLVYPDIGTLTNNPAFRQILPLWASRTKSKPAVIIKSRPTLSAQEIRAQAWKDGEVFQWMAPVAQRVYPGGGMNAGLEIRLRPPTADLAASLNAKLQAKIQQAQTGGSLPFGDFDHQEKGVAFYPLEFFWGGTNLETGGILCRVRWTAEGLRAVCSGGARFVSPFTMIRADGDSDHDEVYDASWPNVGGIVPRTAFLRNQPLPRELLITATQNKALRFVKECRAKEASGLSSGDALSELKNESPDLYAARTAISQYPDEFGLRKRS